MRILAALVLLAVGGWFLFDDHRRRRDSGGPLVVGINTSSEVMNSIRGMVGVREPEPGNGQRFVGAILILGGLGMMLFA